MLPIPLNPVHRRPHLSYSFPSTPLMTRSAHSPRNHYMLTYLLIVGLVIHSSTIYNLLPSTCCTVMSYILCFHFCHHYVYWMLIIGNCLCVDHINMTLSIRSSQTGIDFLDTSLTFFDCSAHRSCVELQISLFFFRFRLPVATVSQKPSSDA